MAPACHRHRSAPRTSAFTLVELLVTLTIISVVAGMALSGLAASRQRAKIDKTKSTIRKLHEIVMPQYESYLTRRVKPSAYTPLDRLKAVRLLMVEEMPDQWADVYPITSIVVSGTGSATAPTRRYAAYKNSVSPTSLYEGGECLAMIVTRGGFAPDAVELFRTDEMGDIDNDGAPEFWDGWGRPIGFIRWPAGYVENAPGWLQANTSPPTTQSGDASVAPDPLDPMRASQTVTHPPIYGAQNDYATFPLIYSPGPDEALNDPLNSQSSGYGIQTGVAWLGGNLATTRAGTTVSGTLRMLNGDIRFDPTDSTVFANSKIAVRDNITNHDLIKK